jgi:Tfp pilus tip-associated adhesin PilY1
VIWKLVTTDFNPNNWTFRKFAELGKNQPITTPVALINDPNNQRVYVMAGTGGDLRASSTNNLFRFATFIDVISTAPTPRSTRWESTPSGRRC